MSRTMTHDAIAHETSINVANRPLPAQGGLPYIPPGSPAMRDLKARLNLVWAGVAAWMRLEGAA